MKTIKIILGIITFFVLAFFLTGFFVTETTYEVRVTVEQPISEVFASFINIDNRKNWIPEIQSIAIVSENSNIVGNIHQVVVDNKGQKR